ncbi:peptidoglycan DD-metalloendopeptidase family protein [Hyphomonas sp.]|uniref:peptidoglycan DD-metalloendopeptidase family protein n=1 Tax=Hyphomonas sp. TaxID=87 RepID=UPI0025C08847|nr:peptidoglycan DD-metalloendopeptidase family protein [Hyphomonas sp.]
MSPLVLVLLALGWSGLVWAGARFAARRSRPRAAQSIWRGAALLVPLPFLLSLVVPALPAPAAAPIADLPIYEPFQVAPGADEVAMAGTAFALPQAGTLVLAALVAGWAVRLGLWLVSQVRLQVLKGRSYPVNRPLRHWTEAMGLARMPQVRIIPQGAPFLAGLVRPAVFLPAALAGREGDAEIIVHELVHLKRGDLLMRPLERVVADVFWFSPFAWAIRSELDYWREAVVDEAAAELTGDRIAYARAITRAARFARPVTSLPVAAMVLKKDGTLKMRVNLLLTDDTRPRRRGLAALAILACAAPLAVAQGVLIRGPATAAAATNIAYAHPVLDKARLTSPFGLRKHPITGEQKLHSGTDLADKLGAAVHSPIDGKVTRAEFLEGYGNLVEVSAGTTALRFGQLDTIKVKAGDTVEPGTVIGTLGQSGQATGPHLHLEVWRGGEQVDPQSVEGLVLAKDLTVSASAKALAPLAQDLPSAGGAAATAASMAPAPRGAFDDCGKLAETLKAAAPPDGWGDRVEAARTANAAAGVAQADWLPKSVTYPKPVYPPEAASARVSAACEVTFDLDADGIPQNKVARCTDPRFESSAAELPSATFEPMRTEGGAAVEAKGIVFPLLYCAE